MNELKFPIGKEIHLTVSVLPEIRNPHCLRATRQNLIISTNKLGVLARYTSPELKTIGLNECKQISLLAGLVVTLSTLGIVSCEGEETEITGITFINSIGNLLFTFANNGEISCYSREFKKLWSMQRNGFITSMTCMKDSVVLCDCRGQVAIYKFNPSNYSAILSGESILMQADDIPTVCPTFNNDGTMLAIAKTNRIYMIDIYSVTFRFVEVDPCLVTSIIWLEDKLRVYTLASNLYTISIGMELELESDDSVNYVKFLEQTWKSQYPSEPCFSTYGASSTAHGLCDFVVFGAGITRLILGPRSSMPYKYPAMVKSLVDVYRHNPTKSPIEYLKSDLEQGTNMNASYLFWDLLKGISIPDLLTFVKEAVNLIETNLTSLDSTRSSPLDDLSIRQRGWMIYLFYISKPYWTDDSYETVMNDKKVAVFVKVIDYLLSYVVDNDDGNWSEYDLMVIKNLVEISDNKELCCAVEENIGDRLELLSTVQACKACGDEIRFEGLWASACGNGHCWNRCALTCTILDTAEAINCTTCDLKLDNFWMREGKIVDLLKEFGECLYCGSALDYSTDDI